MGGRESKQFPLPYDEALKRVNENERQRLQNAFRRMSNNNSWISKSVFFHDVLGDVVPSSLAERIFRVTSSSLPSSSSEQSLSSSSTSSSSIKGLNYREVFSVLVLMTKGTYEEKIKFIYGLFASNNGTFIEKTEMIRLLNDWETGFDSELIHDLFTDGDKAGFEAFVGWIKCHNLGVYNWLFDSNETLCNTLTTPTFYQTLAGVTHLDELEIVELEKRFWIIQGSSNSGQIDVHIIRNLVSPPLPKELVIPFFEALDENKDGHVDFKELSCGVSAACRGPELERQKFVFKMFDVDRDGILDPSEFRVMISSLDAVYKQMHHEDNDSLLEKQKAPMRRMTLQEFLVWTTDSANSSYAREFLKLLYQLCHVCLGLKPLTRAEEGELVRGWIEREEKLPLVTGTVWHLVSMNWWTTWHAYVNAVPISSNATSPFHKTNAKRLNSGSSLSSSSSSVIASNHSSSVVATGFSPLLGAESLSSNSNSNNNNNNNNNNTVNKDSSLATSPRPGHIDNSSLTIPSPYKVGTLTGEGSRLKPKIIRGKDFELIPERLWKALLSWYGDAGVISLPRQVIPSAQGKVEIELYPIAVKILRHQVVARATHVPTVVGGYSAAAIHAANSSSSSSSFSNSSSGNLATTTRRMTHQAAFSRRTTVAQIVDFLWPRLGIKPEDMRLWFYRDEFTMKLLENESKMLEEIGFRDDDGILVEARSRDGTWPEEISSLLNDVRRNHPHRAVSGGIGGVKGVTGLNNLGNTCYMNAALQCVAHTNTLSEYFNSNCHLFELNRTNPLGMKGHIAKRFGDLVRDMWSGESRTVAPIKLRWTIGRYRPHFSGFQQHDSQELLAFLLDGLHEDLNRVTDKPYTELKDSDGRPDDEVASEAWESHVVRNKSIIVDLFHGQLKSKVTCKVCGHESVRFDPFTYLSLPLPMESSAHIEVIVIRQNGSTPVKYGLTMDMDTKYSAIRDHLTQLCKIPSDNLILVEVVHSQFRVTPNEEQKLKNINGSCIFAYEFQRCNFNDDDDSIFVDTFSEIQRNCFKSKLMNGSENTEVEDEEKGHKRSDSVGSNTQSSVISSSSEGCYDLGDCHNGIVVGLHRKMVPQESYFLSRQKYRPELFGLPIILSCGPSTSCVDLYKSVWIQVSRLVSPLPPRDSATQNHALDCDDSLAYEYPFVLKTVQRGGAWCASCPWYEFCRGCPLPCTSKSFAYSSSFIAIDWEQTALHLRYRASQEMSFEEDKSVQESLKRATEPITLGKCLQAFTREEQLGPDEKYYCSSCKTHQLAAKKLQIWKLPPILIVHLKRFHYLNGRWIKSHKIVDFPFRNFEPCDYLASVPAKTLQRFRDLRGSHLEEAEKDEEGQNVDVDDDDDDEEEEENNVFNGSFVHQRRRRQQRIRQESTSLNVLPVKDDDLRDFHEHRLTDGKEPLDIKYNMYAMVCHSGVLGGGHYTSYTKHSGKWYLNNDSTCKEVQESQIDKTSAYMLFYERDSLSTPDYLPSISGPLPNTQDLDDELDLDFKKQCSIM